MGNEIVDPFKWRGLGAEDDAGGGAVAVGAGVVFKLVAVAAVEELLIPEDFAFGREAWAFDFEGSGVFSASELAGVGVVEVAGADGVVFTCQADAVAAFEEGVEAALEVGFFEVGETGGG